MADIAIIDDVYQNAGPIGGILSAMETYPSYSWLVSAVDLPKISARTVQELLEQFESHYESVVPTLDGHTLEPTFALYHMKVRSRLQSAFQNDQRGLQKVLIESNCKIYRTKYPKDFFNMNTPEDLRKLKS